MQAQTQLNLLSKSNYRKYGTRYWHEKPFEHLLAQPVVYWEQVDSKYLKYAIVVNELVLFIIY